MGSDCQPPITFGEFEDHKAFPPKELVGGDRRSELKEWFEENVPVLRQQTGLTKREKEMILWTAGEYIENRRSSLVTCEEYASTLVKRMMFYEEACIFTTTTYRLSERIVEMAREMDQKAQEEGVEAIAPLYGFPIPLKGTMATIDFPSNAGSKVLSSYYAIEDAGMVKLLKNANGLPMGKSTVPEFAGSWVTMNRVDGRVANPYHPSLTAGGSSGGAGALVSFYISPVSVSEDTGGSTRHPAFQNHNFGYDPSRNHYPNYGNPGFSFYNDQVGLNARSYADILLVDAALLGTFKQHTEKKLHYSALSNEKISIGLPRFPWVHFDLPSDALNWWGIPNGLTPSEALMDKYNGATKHLAKAGFNMVQKEWSDVDSPYFGRKVNGLLDVLFRDRKINNLPYDGIGATNLFSFTGQVSEWVAAYLDADVSLKAMTESILPAGDGHNPAGFFEVGRGGDESQTRYAAIAQREKLIQYNQYFEENGVDLILIPGQTCDAITFTEASDSSLPGRFVQEDGSIKTSSTALIHCNLLPYFALKDIPIPKMMIPTGLDSKGRPTGIQVWGKGVPVDYLYDDNYAQIHDLDFLYRVNKVVQSLEEDPQFKRVPAAPVTANLFK
eukprot:CAMPEP_0201476158 /NCGR_PEP_ID=MMETSP0151_2-20130828/1428_1 /ASSEMBLY_ACC=CAM_ASM_000257 /TAXON_ID=200890 /ORGANISM="Paramoeba atlantica, Strain 621/1 / CCAP 1560/9" /LENGTH=612 /DNA_ID=CAMNT_0047856447 /DNA_START=166 /DNA_END=2004 /DNA_ORIENTATION=-